jgi:hypothetical protein
MGSLDLIVSVTGKGNMKLFSLPKPVVPNALEYDPVHTEKLNTSLWERLKKLQTVILSYRIQRNYPVKPMQFSYFDLNLGKYKTISATEVMVTVLDGPTLTDATASNEENSKDKISSKEQFKYQVENEFSSSLKMISWSKLFYGLLFLPFFVACHCIA